MNEFTVEARGSEPCASASELMKALGTEPMSYAAYVGLDVHKDTIAVAVAYPGRGAAEFRGEIANTPRALAKLMRRLSAHGELLGFCYEAGPCGYGIYRQIVTRGHDCVVVAPSLIPRFFSMS